MIRIKARIERLHNVRTLELSAASAGEGAGEGRRAAACSVELEQDDQLGVPGGVERQVGDGAGCRLQEATNLVRVGRFARVHDPEGNPIELWEPPAT